MPPIGTRAHVEAHFLGAGRLVDLAYLALGQRDEPRARAAAGEARTLIDRAIRRSPFARALPRYASQLADLDELQGDAQAAYEVYARLAPQHTLSAVQSAMLSWRLSQATPVIRNGLESVETAIQQVNAESAEDVALEGWTFRVNAAESIPIRPKNEKLCLLEWVQDISRSLLPPVANAGALANAASGAPPHCGSGAIAQRIAEVVCVAAITAQDSLPTGDGRRDVLQAMRTNRLRWAGLQPMPVLPALPAPSGSAKRAPMRTVEIAEREAGRV